MSNNREDHQSRARRKNLRGQFDSKVLPEVDINIKWNGSEFLATIPQLSASVTAPTMEDIFFEAQIVIGQHLEDQLLNILAKKIDE